MSSAFYDIQYKASAGQVNLDQAQGIVECFVAGIGNKDSVGDVCATGAFTKSLMRRKPRVVWGHNWNDPIGKVLEIYEVPPSDPRLPAKMRAAGIGGLYAKVQFNLNSEKGREAFANVAFFGEEQEWSIGYKTLRAQFDQSIQANILYEVELYEVSPVLHGANQLTGTISVKSDEKGGMMPMVISPMEKPIGNEPEMQEDIERKLEEELSARLGTPVKILKTNDGVVYFTRSDGENTSSYKCRYHRGDDGIFMFGRPERFMPQQAIPSAKPVQRMPMGMPSKPMAPTPGAPPVVVPSLVPGATPTSPPMVRFNFDNDGKPSSSEKPRLVDEERDLAEALVKITKRYGKFNEDSTGVWAGYKTAAENPVAKIGVKCANCVLYEGEGKCKIIDKQVEPEGKCRFAIIPDGVVSMGPVQKMNYDIETEEEEVKWLEDIEAKYPGEFLSGMLRGAVKRRRKRRMMGKKVFRLDEYQEKSLEDFSDIEQLDILYVLPVHPDDAFEIKQLIDPIIDYHMVDATVEEGGILFSGGVTQDFVEAVGAAVFGPFLGIEEKALGRQNLAGRAIRRTRGLFARFDPNAWDGDNDGIVQEGTRYERPAIPGINDFASRGRVDAAKARQAWDEYRRAGKPGAQRRTSPQNMRDSEVPQIQQDGTPFERPRGLSSGAKLSPPRSINPTSERLDESINRQDYDWGIDKIVDDFGYYLDELDPDELQDAYDELMSQMRMDRMKARRDGILEDDVMKDDFSATAERLARELNLDEVDAEDEAGRVFDARDKFRVREEQYKAAARNVKRRLRNVPSALRGDEDSGLESGARRDLGSRREMSPSARAASRREARKMEIARRKPEDNLLDERTESGKSQAIKDANNIGVEKLDREAGLASGGSRYPSYDDSDEVWAEWAREVRKERESRGPRPYGDELAYGFLEDLADGKKEGTERSFIKDWGTGRIVIGHQDEQLDEVYFRVLDPENMEEDLGVDWYMSRERDETPRTQKPGWYINRLVFDDYEGYYTDEYDYDFSYTVGPFDSPESAAEYWDKEGEQRDVRNSKKRHSWSEEEEQESGLASGGKKSATPPRRKYPPRYESSKKLADLMESSRKPRRSDYDYSQDSDIIPTEEQKDIIDAVMEGGDVVVGALAGSGKTSTLVALARRLKKQDRQRKVIYLAFNKSAAQDARRRFKGTTVQVMTMDALSYNWYTGLGSDYAQHVKKRFNLSKGSVGTPTTRRAIAQKFSVKPVTITNSSGEDVELSAEDLARMAIDAVERFETSADAEIGLQHFGKGKGTSFKQADAQDIPSGVLELANKIWKSKLDRQDPNGVQLSNSTLTKIMALEDPDLADGSITGRVVDMAMIDEAQDLNPVFSAFIRGQAVQKVTVGDPNQAIYGFRGAKNEMDIMGEAADYVLPLTEVFRFGPEIATAGNKVLSLFNILSGRMVGKGKPGEIIDPPGSMTDADMILARTNAGVVKEALEALQDGKVIATTARAYDELESFIDSWKYLLSGSGKKRPRNMHPELAEYDSIKEIAEDIEKGTASQKTKTLFNLGVNYKMEELEKLLGSMHIWDPTDDGEELQIDYPEDLLVGDLGIIGPANYEILDDSIVLRNTFEIKDYPKATGWTYNPKAQIWTKKASTPAEREEALNSLVDALNNGITGSVEIPDSFKDGDSGKIGSSTWEIKNGRMIINNPPYDKSNKLRASLESQGWKLERSGRKNPKTGKDIWIYTQRLTGNEQEDRDTFSIMTGLINAKEGSLPKFSQMLAKASDEEIVKRAKEAVKFETDEDEKQRLLNVIDAYERNGWARRKGWAMMEKAAKRKREVPPIDTRILTAHLSKGLEADRVKLAYDFWGPKRKTIKNPITGETEEGELEWPDEEHMKVIYVALTRAKKSLDPGSASWISEYTDDDDGLPDDPDPDRYAIGDEGLASGGGRGRRVRTYRGREVTGQPGVGRRPWSEEERQAFRDGVRTRAQTIPGKRRSDQRNAGEERGLASGGREEAEDSDLAESELQEIEAQIRENAADVAGGAQARTELGLETPEEEAMRRISELQTAIENAYDTGADIAELRKSLRSEERRLSKIRRSSDSGQSREEDSGASSVTGQADQGYDVDDAETRVRRTTSISGTAAPGVRRTDIENRGFGIKTPNFEARRRYDDERKKAFADHRQMLRDNDLEEQAKSISESEWARDTDYPSYEEWAERNDIPLSVIEPPKSVSDGRSGWLSSAWNSAKKTIGKLSSNETRNNNDENATWLLPTSKLKNLFESNVGEQMSDAEIAKVLDIPESEVKKWDDPDSGISREAVLEILDKRNAAYGRKPFAAGEAEEELEKIWGFDSAPVRAVFLPGSDGDNEFRILNRQQYELLTEDGITVGQFTADPNLTEQDTPVDEASATMQARRSGTQRTAETSARGNFPITFLARSLGWIGENDTIDSKQSKDAVYEKLSEIADIPRKTFDEWLNVGMTSEFVEELIDRGIVPGYGSVARPEIADELRRLPSPDKAREAVEKFLKEAGIPEKKIGPTFDYTFSPPGGRVYTNLYKQYTEKQGKRAERRASKKIVLSGAGGKGKTNRATISDAEAEQYVSRLNERLEKLGKEPVTKEQLFGVSSDAGLASGSRSSLRNTPRSSGLASGGRSGKKPSSKEIADFVNTATQRGRTSGAANREEMMTARVGDVQVSRLKNALRAREFLADQFPEIADDPNLTVSDFANTDIDNPQEAIDSIQKLDNYIRSILDQADEMSRSMRLQEDAIKRDEASRDRVQEMLDSLEDGDVDVEQGLRSTLDKLNENINSGRAKIEQDFAPIARRRDEMLQLASESRGFSRNRGRNRQQRTKGTRAAANKRLISA